MRLREHSSAILLWLAALVFALLAGVAIPLLGGRSPGPSAIDWTPPPTATAPVVTVQSTTTPIPSTGTPARARQSTPTSAALATATRTSTPPAAPLGTAAPSLTAPATIPIASAAAAASTRGLAHISRGPANLRAGPGATFTVLGTAKDGDEFEVAGRSEDDRWVRLCCIAGAPVWVSIDLIELPAAIETLPVVR